MTTAAPTRRQPPAKVDAPTQYAIDVVEGRVVAGALIKMACERHLRDLEDGADRGLWFDVDSAERCIKFFSFLKHSKGEWAGRPLTSPGPDLQGT